MFKKWIVKLSHLCCLKPKNPKTNMKETPWFTGGGCRCSREDKIQMFASHLGKQSPTTLKHHRLVRGESTEEES